MSRWANYVIHSCFLVLGWLLALVAIAETALFMVYDGPWPWSLAAFVLSMWFIDRVRDRVRGYILRRRFIAHLEAFAIPRKIHRP